MSKQLQKAIELAKKTGDRIIVFNGENDENACVIMPFDEYERLINVSEVEEHLTQEEMLDSINQDVAEWKNGHSFGFPESDKLEALVPVSEEDNDEIDDKVEDEYEKRFLNNEEEGKKSSWNIPTSRKTAAEEIIEEDRHYLEEIPY